MRMLLTILRAAWAAFRGNPLELEYASRRFHLFPDGKVIPAIMGADGADEDETEDTETEDDSTEDETEETVEDDDSETPEAELEDDDKFDKPRALRTIRKQRAKEKQLKRERDEKAAEAERYRQEQESEQERKDRELAEAKEQLAAERTKRQSSAKAIAIRDAAIELGVNPKRVKAALKLIDNEDITLDEDGNVDEDELGAAIGDFLDEYPEFAAEKPEPPAEDDEDEEDELERKPKRKPAARPDRKRTSTGEMTEAQAARLAANDPEKFAEMFDKGEIPASAMGGKKYSKLKAGDELGRQQLAD